MQLLKHPLVQLGLVISLGGALGLAYRLHREGEQEWQASHYRISQKASFPLVEGLPFVQQYYIDETGTRVEVPLPSGQRLELAAAAWWQLADTGEMRFWSEERDPVYPRRVAAERP